MKRYWVIPLAFFLGVGAAVAQDVRYNFDDTADFSKFKTYKWVGIKDADQVDEPTAHQITSTIDAELAKKDLTKTDADSADLFIAYQTAITTEKPLNAYSTGWTFGPGWGPGWYGDMVPTMTTVTTDTVYAGQLDLDIYYVAKKQLVWRGIVSKALDPKANSDKRTRNIQKCVAKLLSYYPPKKKVTKSSL